MAAGSRAAITTGVTQAMRGASHEGDRFIGTLSRATGTSRDFSRGLFAATVSATGLRGAVLAAGTSFIAASGLVRGIEAFLGLSAQFERSLSTFQAVTHATTSEMAQASKAAIDLGNDIRLPQTSAADAAVAMTELGRGGLTVADSMAAARGSLQLAAAAGADFATAAQIQVQVLRAFNLEGADAVQVADVLANSANASTAEITDMALALRQSSAVAHEAGISLEDTATAVSILANAGIVGSDAGTSLRTMLLRLTPSTKKARDELHKLGVVTTDSTGTFLPFPRILENFRRGLSGLTQAQRQSALMTIFGQDAIRASEILTSQSIGTFRAYRTQIERQGGAAETAAAKNRGLAGTFDALRSNVETIGINIGRHALPGLTNFVRGTNEAITSFVHSESTINTAQAAVEGFSGALRGAGDIVRTVAPALEGFGRAFATVLNFTGGDTILAAVIAMKGFGLATKVTTGLQNQLGRVMAITSGQMVLQRDETGKLTLTEVAHARALQNTVAAEIEQGALIARRAESIVAASQAEQRYMDILTGRIQTTAAVASVTRELTMRETELSAATLQDSITAEENVRVREAAFAASSKGTVAGFGGTLMRPTSTGFVRDFAAEADAATLAVAKTEAALARTAVQAEITSVAGTSAFKAIGASALAMVGGTFGLITLGIGAIATAFLLLHNRGVSTMEALRSELEKFGEATDEAAQRRAELARINASIPTERTAVQEAKLNEAIAKGEAIRANATGSAQQQRAAYIQQQRAAQQLKAAEDALKESLTQRVTVQQQLRGARDKAADERRLTITRLLTKEQNAEADAVARAAATNRAPGVDRIAAIARARRAAHRQNIADLRAEARADRDRFPILAHQLELLAELEEKAKRAATPRELQIILKVTEAAGISKIGQFFLGNIVSGGSKGQESHGEALHNLLTEAVDDVKPAVAAAGNTIGAGLAAAIARSLVAHEHEPVASLKAVLARTIAEGESQIQDSIAEAKTNLLSLGSGLAEQISEAIDNGPLGQQLARMQQRLDALQATHQGQGLGRNLRNAKRDLAIAREQLDPLASVGLTDAEKARRRHDVEAFLQPYKDKLKEAQDAVQEFSTQSVINRLSKTQEAHKKRVVRGINDIVAAFADGRISAGKATARIAQIVGQHRADFKLAGHKLGLSFTLGFRTQLKGVIDEINELNKPAVRRRDRTGFPGANVVRPSETIAAQLQEINKARKAVQDAQLKEAKDQSRYQRQLRHATLRIQAKLEAGIKPGKARKQTKRELQDAGVPIKGRR